MLVQTPVSEPLLSSGGAFSNSSGPEKQSSFVPFGSIGVASVLFFTELNFSYN